MRVFGQVQALVRRRVALVAAAAVLGVGVAACTPPPPPPPPSAPSSATPASPTLQQIWNLTNQDRAANHIGGLGYNGQLAALAQDWANHLAATETLVHRDLGAVISQPAYAGFWTLGENLLDGPSSLTPQAMETAWMNSPLHRANILNGSFNVMGAGLAFSPDGRVWVVVNFGGTR